MYLILAILKIVCALFFVLAILCYIYFQVRNVFYKKKIDAIQYERIKWLHNKLESKETVTKQDILPYVENPLTREATYSYLMHYNKSDLFPKEYYNVLRSGESFLVNWLEINHQIHTEEVVYIKRITIKDKEKDFNYEVFRYRTSKSANWILGIVGPFFNNNEPYAFPYSTYSRLKSFSKNSTPENEVKWVHSKITKYRMPKEE